MAMHARAKLYKIQKPLATSANVGEETFLVYDQSRRESFEVPTSNLKMAALFKDRYMTKVYVLGRLHLGEFLWEPELQPDPGW